MLHKNTSDGPNQLNKPKTRALILKSEEIDQKVIRIQKNKARIYNQ